MVALEDQVELVVDVEIEEIQEDPVPSTLRGAGITQPSTSTGPVSKSKSKRTFFNPNLPLCL
jgi:hypothetical protein